ncbi:P2X purinoceptor 7 [Holothuria leucospilota]|uniref:P2X purinoceptor 7 n=1 Tax=Holothuria leucospilota TaxID=206669 RepID=A0A9Q1BUC2_HOLLE|nr:P2X purinoceptor 7 [Holothuria leucospilota]
MVENMDEQAMRRLLWRLAERQPGLFLDIWELQPRAEGPAHQAQPHWCLCGKCLDMPIAEEELCCASGQDNCLSDEPEMNALVLDPGVLALRTIHEIFGMRGNPEPNRGMRHAAYRQFIMWQYGRMGQHNRQLSHPQLLCN